MRGAAYLRASYLDGFQALVLARGGNPTELMTEAQMGVIPTESHRYLINLEKFVQLLELSAQRLRYPELGLDLARQQDATIFGPLLQKVSLCKSLDQALVTIIEYLQLQVSGVSITLNRAQGAAKICMHTPLASLENQPQYQRYSLAILYSTIKSIMGGNCPLRAVYFPMSEPDDVHPFHQFFACPIAFNQNELAITVDSRLLEQSIADVSDMAAQQIDSMVREYSPHEFIQQLEKRMSSYVLAGNCNLALIARDMGLSERTLQRRLQHNGSSFLSLLNSVRARLAKQFMQHTCYRLTDIATLLGYQQQGSFTRSYQRWYGYLPSAEPRSMGLGESLDASLHVQTKTLK